MNGNSKLQIILFSDPNFLAVNLLENLLTKNCIVNIVSEDINKWKERTEYLSASSHFSLIGLSEYKKLKNFNYAIFCGGFLTKENTLTDFKKFISNKNFGNAKTLAIFPFETFSFNTSSKISINDNAGMIYLGDLMGPRIDLESDLLLPSLITEMVIKRTVTLGIGEIFYPLFIADVAKTIVKCVFSFGPYGKETFLIGNQISSGDFWKQNMKSFPDLKVLYDTKIETRFIPKGYEVTILNSNLNICLNETYKWLIQKDSSNAVVKTKLPKKVKIKKPSRLRFLHPYLLPISLMLLFPLITIAISISILYLSYKQFLSENISGATNSILFAKTVFVIGKGESDVLSRVPVLGEIYKETSYASIVGETAANLAFNAVPLVESGRQILGNVLDTGIYDIKTPSFQIKSRLDYIYGELAYFQTLTQGKASQGVLSAKQTLQLLDFDKLKNLSREGSVLAANLPAILGQDANKNYLILFENNMELRPTGGFIGSYGVANFGGGKLNGLQVNDIYSADGQLRGHVEPPSPIKNYLGEANWWFRDSNWDPDFPTSGQRAEWFLTKEMDQQVDGVIAVDLETIKDILKYTGPIFLPDYNLTITPDNLYEKTQEEAQANSFPGSRQKASFLTALSRILINEISRLNPKDRILVLKAFYENLEERHIQVYLHDTSASDALNKLDWDGSIQSYSCGNSCYSDFFGDVEANVGDNKANYFIKRDLSFKVNFDGQKLTHQLIITLTNSANPSLGPSGIYKSYVRAMIPSDSSVLNVKSVTGEKETNLQPEITQASNRQEVGILTTVAPGQTERVEYVWQSNLPPDNPINSYGLYVRKEAGVDASPLSLEFSGISNVSSQPVFTLTKGSTYTYNTNLSQDFFARLSWK